MIPRVRFFAAARSQRERDARGARIRRHVVGDARFAGRIDSSVAIPATKYAGLQAGAQFSPDQSPRSKNSSTPSRTSKSTMPGDRQSALRASQANFDANSRRRCRKRRYERGDLTSAPDAASTSSPRSAARQSCVSALGPPAAVEVVELALHRSFAIIASQTRPSASSPNCDRRNAGGPNSCASRPSWRPRFLLA